MILDSQTHIESFDRAKAFGGVIPALSGPSTQGGGGPSATSSEPPPAFPPLGEASSNWNCNCTNTNTPSLSFLPVAAGFACEGYHQFVLSAVKKGRERKGRERKGREKGGVGVS